MGTTVTPLHNWRNKKNKSGCYKIHLRVYIDGLRDYYEVKSPRKIPEADWADKSGMWVKNTNPFAYEVNQEIRRMIGVIEELERRLLQQGRKLTFFHLDKEFGFKGNREIFNDYFKNYMKKPPPTAVLTDVTWEKYSGFVYHLDQFNPAIRFDEIDWEMVARIRNFMVAQRNDKGNLLAPSTVKSYFDKFKVVLEHAAKKDGYLDIKLVESYFEEVKVIVPERKEGRHLEITELLLFKDVETDPRYPTQDRDRKIFMLQCYTGFYYTDMKKLLKTDVRLDFEYGYYILGERYKNGKANIIPLWKFPSAIDYMNEFKDNDHASPYFFRRDIFVHEQTYNKTLKALATAAGIVREVSNRVARHTNIQMWIRLGADKPVVKKMAGHSSESTTENYYRVQIAEVIEGTNRVDFKKIGF
ncbi:phage integrase SAM-like domain-containing protein [Chitinophaga arvensicola]|uniref:Phage integrase family protein n=1 Tax=Chitinophaga arvensicola TaxID=29529 RepID=A0A1I0PKW7_9BACT|nr:phage integrase SAM-like domain-containing protein [Chitinophaga arvensicola]SEW15050.1 Phage integrase family protein [Chitinophaga arvensicola]